MVSFFQIKSQLIMGLIRQDHIINLMFTEFNKTNNVDRVQKFISETKKNGYFGTLKKLDKSANQNKDMDTFYRKKVESHYAKKIKKPFRLFDQPEYKRQKQFFNNFNEYMSSLKQFQKINQTSKEQLPRNPSYQLKDLYCDTLTYDPSKISDFSPQNIEKRKKRNRTLDVEENSLQPKKFGFPTTIGFGVTEPRFQGTQKRIRQKQSPIHLNLQDIQSQGMRSPKTFISRTKFASSNRKIGSKKKTQQNMSRDNININDDEALKTLNGLLGTDLKKRNFRISKQQLHQLIRKKYGHDIITSFFEVQAIENFQGIIKLIKQILSSSYSLTQLLTFLTFDYNVDGVVTQDQLTKLSDLISVQNPINSDIHTLVRYSSENPNQEYQIDLPLTFLKHPTYKEYLKINSLYRNQKADKIKGILRHFTMKIEDEDETNYDHKNLPVINKNQDFLKKKKIRLNFANFQKAFEEKRPNFIQDLAIFLLGKQDFKQTIKKSTSQLQSPRKVANISKNKDIRTTKSIQSRTQQNSFRTRQGDSRQKITKFNDFLRTMKDEKRKLSTIHYV